jgi:DNA uptake protein ComE-like DNA-binding protein
MQKLAVLIVSWLLLAVPAAAQELPAPGLAPDHPLYGLDRALERLHLILTLDHIKKAELHLQHAEERLAEAWTMAEINRTDLLQRLCESYESDLNRSAEIAAAAERVGRNITALSERITLATSHHLEVLEAVLEKVPEQAKPAIERALNVSVKGRERALGAIMKVSPDRIVELQLSFVERCSAKALEASNRTKAELAKRWASRCQQAFNYSHAAIEKAEKLGLDVAELAERIADATTRHLRVLQEVHKAVPEQAKPAIERALNVSVAGQEKVLEKLEEIAPAKAEKIVAELPAEIEEIRKRIGIR